MYFSRGSLRDVLWVSPMIHPGITPGLLQNSPEIHPKIPQRIPPSVRPQFLPTFLQRFFPTFHNRLLPKFLKRFCPGVPPKIPERISPGILSNMDFQGISIGTLPRILAEIYFHTPPANPPEMFPRIASGAIYRTFRKKKSRGIFP